MEFTYTRTRSLLIAGILFLFPVTYGQESLSLNEKGYFSMDGLDVTVFSDFYPNFHFGVVTASALFIAIIADLLMLPAIFSLLERGKQRS